MEVELRLGGWLRGGGRAVRIEDALTLLDAVAQEGSVAGVARRLGLSYRAAWDRIGALEAGLGLALVAKTRGHGSALTAAGAALHGALAAGVARLEAPLAREARALSIGLAGLRGGVPRVAVAASHDPLLMTILDAMPEVETTVVGSSAAVGRLLAGEADLAGFHAGCMTLPDWQPFASLGPEFAVHGLFVREQGLLVAPGNPLGLAELADLTRARYVNRQRGSGTRLWFDRLLAEAGIAPAAIPGYRTEEFTHQAVAALVASGAADAGMGVRAEADRFGLGFLPLGRETYFLAAAASAPPTLTAALVARAAAGARDAAGYQPGEVLPVDADRDARRPDGPAGAPSGP